MPRQPPQTRHSTGFVASIQGRLFPKLQSWVSSLVNALIGVVGTDPRAAMMIPTSIAVSSPGRPHHSRPWHVLRLSARLHRQIGANQSIVRVGIGLRVAVGLGQSGIAPGGRRAEGLGGPVHQQEGRLLGRGNTRAQKHCRHRTPKQPSYHGASSLLTMITSASSQPKTWFCAAALALTLAALVYSGIAPHDRLTWAREVSWVTIGTPVLTL